MKRMLDMDVQEHERHPNFTLRQEQDFFSVSVASSVMSIEQILRISVNC
jgi:hypothetical protein